MRESLSRPVGRPPTLASSLYGPVRQQRVAEYMEESYRRWSRDEIGVLEMWGETATVGQLLEMLPGRNDQQVRRMMEYLSS